MTTDHRTTPLSAADLQVGQELPPVVHQPTEVQLFRYSAATWNAHRIHFDRGYTIEAEGYPNVLVQSHLHGAWLTSYCTDLAGEAGEVKRLSYSVRRFAIPGDILTVRGTVRAVHAVPGSATLVSLELNEVRESDDVACCIGEADILLPENLEA